MSFNDLNLIKVSSKQDWDQFIDNSEFGTIFSTTTYLDACDVSYDLYFIHLNGNTKAGLCLIRGASNKNVISDDLIIYSGLIFNTFNKDNIADIVNQKFLISEFVSKQLPKIYNEIDMTFSPEYVDPRAFQFYGYGKNIKQYNLLVKFTSHVDTSSMIESNDVLETETFFNIRPTKRRDIKKALSEGYNVSFSSDPSIFLDFYEQNLKNQKALISKEYLSRLNNLINNLVRNKMAVIINISDKNNTNLYSVIYCWDRRKAYYLFGSGTLVNQKHWQGIAANWEAFQYVAKSHKIKLIDLEGINSPERGKFKLSLGGKIIPYYNISLT